MQGILFLLAFPAFGALGGRSLVPKGSPRTKVFAALAPLDFQISVASHDPDGNVTGGAESLVLAWDNVVRFVIFRLAVTLQTRGRTVAFFAAHDTVLLAIGSALGGFGSDTTTTFQVVGIVDNSMKLGKFRILGGVGWTVVSR